MNRRFWGAVVIVLVAEMLLVGRVSANRSAASDSDQLSRPASNTGGTVTAQEFEPVMLITAKTAVQIPGHVLGAGVYSFRLINSNNEVVVADAEGGHRYGVFPVATFQAKDDDAELVLTTPPGSDGPDRILAWHFPGQSTGYEFIYRKGKDNPIQAVPAD